MTMRLFLALVCFGYPALSGAQTSSPTGIVHELEVEGVKRSYRLHVPEAIESTTTPVPLVFVLHGGGTSAAVISRAGWSPLADEKKFIVVYPDGINQHWNDGRDASKYAQQDANTDDVAFILAIIDEVSEKHPVDQSRVYTTGLSNGGFMSQRLAIEAADHFAAAATVIATLPTPYADGTRPFAPKAAVSILFMNGTEDTFMPYEGGKLTPNLTPYRIDNDSHDFGQGTAIATDQAVALWLAHNQLNDVEPVVATLPDRDPDDGCRVIHSRWSDRGNPAVVELYRVEGGGHTIPGGSQYLPKRIIGPLCGDIDGIRVVWEFFEDKVSNF